MRRQIEKIEAGNWSNLPRQDVFQAPSIQNIFSILPQTPANVDGGLAEPLLPFDLPLPLSAYRGVAIRIVLDADGQEDRVAVVLSHSDPGCEIPLFEADDDQDVIAEWRSWGAKLGLPLLMEGLDGRIITAEKRLGEVEVDKPRPRRRHALLARRRPRFLTRRRVGQMPLVPFVHRDEREISAAE